MYKPARFPECAWVSQLLTEWLQISKRLQIPLYRTKGLLILFAEQTQGGQLDPHELVGGMSGLQLCALPEPALFRRVEARELALSCTHTP